MDGDYHSGHRAYYVVAGGLAGAECSSGRGWWGEDIGLAGDPDMDLLPVSVGNERSRTAVVPTDRSFPTTWRRRRYLEVWRVVGVCYLGSGRLDSSPSPDTLLLLPLPSDISVSGIESWVRKSADYHRTVHTNQNVRTSGLSSVNRSGVIAYTSSRTYWCNPLLFPQVNGPGGTGWYE